MGSNSSFMSKIKYLIITMRPKQWIKNIFLFAGLIFSKSFLQIEPIIKTIYGFVIFSIVSGVVYIINDLVDKENDLLHPIKKKRPIASGVLKPIEALIPAFIMFTIAIIIAYRIDLLFFVILLAYFVLVLLYSLLLKHIVILDVIIISLGFVLRTLGGTAIIRVEISPWLIMCTTFLSLYLALNKRKNELLLLSGDAEYHRRNLAEYTPSLIDQMLPVVTSITIMSYSLYTFTSGKSHYMMITIPFVLYGIFRYQYIASLQNTENGDGNPENLLLKDMPLLINILLWSITSMIIVFFYY